MSVRPGASPFAGRPDVGIGGSIGDDRGAGADAGLATFVMMAVMAGSSLFLLGGSDLNHRIMLCLGIGMCLLTSMTLAPELGVVLSLIFPAMLGGIKRWVIPMWGYEISDPLMLVMPTVALVLFSQQLFRRKIPTDTLLSKLMIALLVILSLEVFNPLQGGLMIGLAGALFYVIPVLWYFIGRSIGSPAVLRTITTTVLVIGFGTAIYGLKQQFLGLMDCEKEWVRDTGWILGVGAAQKVFSTFCSTAEYAQFLGLAVVIGFVRGLQRRVVPLLVGLGCFVTLFFTGNRGPVLLCLAVFAVIWAVQGRTVKVWIPRLIVAAILAVLALAVGLKSVSSEHFENAAARDLVQHQVQGLSDPLGHDSTGGLHAKMIRGGIMSGFKSPLGEGVGVTNMIQGRVGDDSDSTQAISGSSEFDISNMFVAAGLPGGILYCVIVFIVLRTVIRLWLRTRNESILECLAILAFSIGLWEMGSHYASVIVCWLIIGTMDRMQASFEKQNKKLRPRPLSLREQFAANAAARAAALSGHGPHRMGRYDARASATQQRGTHIFYAAPEPSAPSMSEEDGGVVGGERPPDR